MPNKIKKLLKDFVLDVATEMGISVTDVIFTEGYKMGCRDTHLMKIVTPRFSASILVYQSDIDNLIVGKDCSRLEVRFRSEFSIQNRLSPHPPHKTKK